MFVLWKEEKKRTKWSLTCPSPEPRLAPRFTQIRNREALSLACYTTCLSSFMVFCLFLKGWWRRKGDTGSVWQVSSQKEAEGALYYGKTRVGSVSLVSSWNESKNFVFWKLVGAFFKSKRGSFWTAHSLDHSKKCLTTTHETKRSRHLPELHENLHLILEHWIFFGKSSRSALWVI